jgi:class 3 adenylate cyclase/tetratricopeptide (TPR) repeat protein
MASRLAVLIVADLVDYSRIMGEDEARAIGAIRELRDSHLEPKVAEQGGEVLKRMGDGWIIAFNSVTSAIQSATAVQNNLSTHPVIKLRMGMHIGEIVEDETDFYGAGVNLAQRLQTEAPPGGIMISQDLHRQLTGELSRAFTDAGSFNLKNIALPVTGYQWRPQIRQNASAGELPTIAVDPFAYAPENGEVESVSLDLRDQLIFRLSNRTGIRVLDEASENHRNSVYILRGRLRISGNRGRLNLSLVVRESAATIWTGSYDEDTSDIFAFCDAMIERAMTDLRIQINAFDDDRIAHLPDDQLSISELRSRAASSFYKCTVESWEYASQLLERAVRLNPSDPMALAMRAHSAAMLSAARFKLLDPAQIEGFRNDVDRAVELAPRSDFVFTTRALMRTLVDRDAAGARKDAERALELNPAYHIGYDSRACAHMLAGEFDKAIQDFRKSISLSKTDPLMPFRLFQMAVACHAAGRQEEALEAIESAIQLRPSIRSYFMLKAMIHSADGDVKGAEEARRRASQLASEPSILAPRPSLPDEFAGLVDALAPGGGNPPRDEA